MAYVINGIRLRRFTPRIKAGLRQITRSMLMLKIHAQKLGDVAILCLQGGILIGETTELEDVVGSFSTVSAIVLDLTRVSRIDARGLGVLLELLEQTRANGIEFRLMNVTRLIGQVLEMTCLNSVFRISSQAEVASMAARGQHASVVQLVPCAQQAYV